MSFCQNASFFMFLLNIKCQASRINFLYLFLVVFVILALKYRINDITSYAYNVSD